MTLEEPKRVLASATHLTQGNLFKWVWHTQSLSLLTHKDIDFSQWHQGTALGLVWHWA